MKTPTSASAAREYLTSHAIDLRLAADLGWRAEGDTLYVPYPGEDGEPMFERAKQLPDGNFIQPKGESLKLYWPCGRDPERTDIILCEGEADTLAAASALARDSEFWADTLPVGLPGASTNAERVCEELTGRKVVFLPLDADDAGHKAIQRLTPVLLAAGLRVGLVELPRGKDLADCLYAAENPTKPDPPHWNGCDWLRAKLADSEAESSARLHEIISGNLKARLAA